MANTAFYLTTGTPDVTAIKASIDAYMNKTAQHCFDLADNIQSIVEISEIIVDKATGSFQPQRMLKVDGADTAAGKIAMAKPLVMLDMAHIVSCAATMSDYYNQLSKIALESTELNFAFLGFLASEAQTKRISEKNLELMIKLSTIIDKLVETLRDMSRFSPSSGQAVGIEVTKAIIDGLRSTVIETRSMAETYRVVKA